MTVWSAPAFTVGAVLLVAVSGSRSKTQGRACLIARMSSPVILNSISMANSSPDSMPYRPSNSSCITARCLRNWSSCPLLIRSVHGCTWPDVARTVYSGISMCAKVASPGESGLSRECMTRRTPSLLSLISSGTECASGLVTRSSPIWLLT